MNLMGKMLKAFNMSCEDTSPLISRMMDDELPLAGKLRLKIHLSLCDVCNFYKNQLNTIRALAKKLAQEEPMKIREVRLSPEAKEKIKQCLKEEL